ncbi:hypothetical protein CDL15_Pgr023225 [Punica granatum]|uniref:Uncharacterized protein n=1 Tax=Punica granatum TaxID=22663 RepID=A0A218X4E4_PUNGR|nr:hypothetical protein CDL15_Pgr023225 [Punica granatum]
MAANEMHRRLLLKPPIERPKLKFSELGVSVELARELQLLMWQDVELDRPITSTRAPRSDRTQTETDRQLKAAPTTSLCFFPPRFFHLTS